MGAASQSGVFRGIDNQARSLTRRRGWNRGVRLESLANLAHELRTPVQTLLGYLDVLREECGAALSRQHQEIFHRMNASVQDLAQTVENVLDFAFAGASAESRMREAIDLRELMAEVAPAIEALNQEKKLTLNCIIDESVRVVAMRRRPLKSILLNLAINAVKFTARGSVTIRFSRRNCAELGRCLQLDVHDSGPGIDRADIARAFRACVQLSSSAARSFRGMGLGLAVVKRNVCAMHGRMTVDTAPNRGTSFTIRIPMEPRARVDDAQDNRALARQIGF